MTTAITLITPENKKIHFDSMQTFNKWCRQQGASNLQICEFMLKEEARKKEEAGHDQRYLNNMYPDNGIIKGLALSLGRPITHEDLQEFHCSTILKCINPK